MQYDVTIVGGGIVGLATGWTLQQQNPGIRLAIVEKESALGMHQTDRNSGVIHSGIYYKPGSAKAVNCVKGYGMLLDFCRQYEIPFDCCGKLIMAGQEHEIPTLESIYQRGLENGLQGLRMLDDREAKEIEPYCAAIRGIYVPQAGIVDYRVVAEKLALLIRDQGGDIITNFKVDHIQEDKDSISVFSGSRKVVGRQAVACAGLYADRIAAMAGLEPPHQIVPFRGEFYALDPSAEHLVRGLIYPVPDINFPFLGVHLTRRITGGVEAGPNAVLAFRREGYRHLDIHAGELWEAMHYPGLRKLAIKHWRKGMNEMYRSFSKRAFLKSLQRLVPALRMEHISRSRSGVRAQALDRHGNMVDDYVVLEQDRMLHICNAPSPAATSCLSIGDYISSIVSQQI